MKCPYCKYRESAVIDTRPVQDNSEIYRRRECLLCKRRFTTYEVVQEMALMVVKKDGRREPFSREKMRAGILKACEKRPVSMEEIEELVRTVERECRINFEKEVSSAYLGDQVIERLKKLDPVAYVRFASVYRQFEDVSHFMKEIRRLKRTL